MDNTLRKIKEQCSTELIQYANKAGWSASMAETVCNLVCAIEKICKIDQMERMEMTNGGYSGAGTWMARGDYGHPVSHGMYSGADYAGNSSYGNYGDGHSMGYGNDTSGAHWVRGHYSRDGARDMLVQQMEEQIKMASDPQERERLVQAKQALMR